MNTETPNSAAGGSALQAELAELSNVEKRSNSVLAATLIFAFLFGVGVVIDQSSLNDPDVTDDVRAAMKAGIIIWGVLAAVCVVLAIGAATKSRWPAVLMWLPIAIWWLNFILLLTEGQFAIPWLAAVGTWLALNGTLAVFRYRKLLRADRARENVAEAFE